MQTFWLKFTDGSVGYCEGQSAFDAVRIAEHLTGKTVDLEEGKKYRPHESESVKVNPYPVSNMIWQFEHPIHGKTPNFCYRRGKCIGSGSCPNNPSCTE